MAVSYVMVFSRSSNPSVFGGGGLAFAEARTAGGMTLSGPNAWRGSMKDVRIFPHFLHSAMFEDIPVSQFVSLLDCFVSCSVAARGSKTRMAGTGLRPAGLGESDESGGCREEWTYTPWTPEVDC